MFAANFQFKEPHSSDISTYVKPFRQDVQLRSGFLTIVSKFSSSTGTGLCCNRILSEHQKLENEQNVPKWAISKENLIWDCWRKSKRTKRLKRISKLIHEFLFFGEFKIDRVHFEREMFNQLKATSFFDVSRLEIKMLTLKPLPRPPSHRYYALSPIWSFPSCKSDHDRYECACSAASGCECLYQLRVLKQLSQLMLCRATNWRQFSLHLSVLQAFCSKKVWSAQDIRLNSHLQSSAGLWLSINQDIFPIYWM
jgi:hypothetical protein